MKHLFIPFLVFGLFLCAGCDNSQTVTQKVSSKKQYLLLSKRANRKFSCGNTREQRPIVDKRVRRHSRNRNALQHKQKKRLYVSKLKSPTITRRQHLDYAKWAQPIALQVPSSYQKTSMDFQKDCKGIESEKGTPQYMKKWRALKERHFGKRATP